MRRLVRRWYWWVPALAATMASVYGVHRAMHPPWAETEAWAKYRQVRVGMTEEEVQAVFQGQRPTSQSRSLPFWEPKTNSWEREGYISWHIGDDVVLVWLDNQSRVYGKEATIQDHDLQYPSDNQTWWDRLRDWLGW